MRVVASAEPLALGGAVDAGVSNGFASPARESRARYESGAESLLSGVSNRS
jgi:hypothetical protein